MTPTDRWRTRDRLLPGESERDAYLIGTGQQLLPLEVALQANLDQLQVLYNELTAGPASPVASTGDSLHIHQAPKGQNGHEGLDGYGVDGNDAVGGGRYQGATRRDSGPDGRFIARAEADRFWEKVTPAANGCWGWTGTINSDGYGLFRVKRDGVWRYVKAHRYAYEQRVGPIPDGHDLDHTCHTNDPTCPGGPSCPHRRCVLHLEAVTDIENRRRAGRRRRSNTTPESEGTPR